MPRCKVKSYTHFTNFPTLLFMARKVNSQFSHIVDAELVFAVPNLVIFTRRVGELLNHPIGHIGLNSFVSFFLGGFSCRSA